MRKEGTIVRWNAERAFGFIRSPQTAADVFFHARDFHGAAAPRAGLAVIYEEIHVGGKGPRAMAVQLANGAPLDAPRIGRNNRPLPREVQRGTGAARRPRIPATAAQQRTLARSRRDAQAPAAASAPVALLFTAGWIGLLGWGIYQQRLPAWWWTLAAVLALNLLTFVVYAIDKSAARAGSWRTAENQLHLLSLLGGWPGAWLAQQGLRHKSSKRSFQVTYWGTVVLHCAALAAWVTGMLH
jgi:uncharacterized membrane protein YsdA (DUF1294 family)/cold shock CspA family protein